MDDETITITKKEHERLLRRAALLSALEAGGVDNWEWYHESCKEAGLDGAGFPLEQAT